MAETALLGDIPHTGLVGPKKERKSSTTIYRIIDHILTFDRWNAVQLINLILTMIPRARRSQTHKWPHRKGSNWPTIDSLPFYRVQLAQRGCPLYSNLPTPNNHNADRKQWENPQSTAISYVSVVTMILAARYLPLIRWGLKVLYVCLGFSAVTEISGRTLLGRSLMGTTRPRKYYTIPKDTVESVLEDLEQLFDFFLIEFQRILFVENLPYTIASFVAALSSYWLVRFLPLWGLALIGVTIAYLGPLVYLSNKQLIDQQINNVHDMINSHAREAREMAEAQTTQAAGIVKQYVGEYTAKAHEIVAPLSSLAPSEVKHEDTPVIDSPVKIEHQPEAVALEHPDFPVAPHNEPLPQLRVDENELPTEQRTFEPTYAM